MKAVYELKGHFVSDLCLLDNCPKKWHRHAQLFINKVHALLENTYKDTQVDGKNSYHVNCSNNYCYVTWSLVYNDNAPHKKALYRREITLFVSAHNTYCEQTYCDKETYAVKSREVLYKDIQKSSLKKIEKVLNKFFY